jgi:small GTP-binding protein
MERHDILVIIRDIANNWDLEETDKITDCIKDLSSFWSTLFNTLELSMDNSKYSIMRYQTIGEIVDFIIRIHGWNNVQELRNTECMNIIVAGKSGVGKSSFLNYLVDKEIFQTGIGDPVTQDYFESTSFEANSITYNLFDTKGIEPTTTTECSRKIIERIDKCDESNNFFDWIHTVYYCFSAPSKRIEDFEIDFIKKIQKYTGVVILLTKRDLVDESTINALQDQIKNQIGTTVQVIPVCSVEQRTRKNVSHKSGRDEVLKASILGLWNKLSQRLPSRCFKDVFESQAKLNLPASISDGITKLMAPYIEKSAIDNKTIFINIDLLCDFPTLGHLKSRELDDGDRIFIREFAKCAARAFHNIVTEIRLINFNRIKKENNIISKNVFDLYEKMTGEKPHVIFSHKSEEAIESIRNYQYNKALVENGNYEQGLIESLHDVDECWIFDSWEKKQAINAYTEFQNNIKGLSNDIKGLIDNYVNTYRTELYQYGQDCIRDDAFTGTESRDYCDTNNNMLSNEKAYYNAYLEAKKDGIISNDEKAILESLKKSFNLSQKRAKEIEEYADKSH